MGDDLKAYNATEQFEKDGVWDAEFLKWKGYVDRNAMLRATYDAVADAVTASWKTKGENGGDMAIILDQYRGNGKESFKTIMNNMVKIADIGTDAYAEIIFDDVTDVGKNLPADLMILPPDNIRQVIKRGRIVRYEELSDTVGTGATWKPQKIFHLYNPIGSTTHGQSTVQNLEPILLHMEQLLKNGSELFEQYSKAMNILSVFADTDAEKDRIAAEWAKAMRTPKADFVISADTLQKIERVGAPMGNTLDPAHWDRVLVNRLLMGRRVSENILGIGTQNSEESARMQMAGFRQMVRFRQQNLEEALRWQVFALAFPEDTPDIKFSFATEAQEESLERMRADIQMLQTLTQDPEMGGIAKLSIMKKLIEMGVIENE